MGNTTLVTLGTGVTLRNPFTTPLPSLSSLDALPPLDADSFLHSLERPPLDLRSEEVDWWQAVNAVRVEEDLDERLNNLKNLQPLQITPETSITDIQAYRQLLEDGLKTVGEGLSEYGRLNGNPSLLAANRHLVNLEAAYEQQIQDLQNQEVLSEERKTELNKLSLNPKNHFTGNGEGTWFSNQSDRSIYTTIVTAGKEAQITADHKDQLAVAAVIENRGESSRWNPGGSLDAEGISRQRGQFVAINGLGSINSEDDAVKALAKKFGGIEAAREYVQYMYQTLQYGSEEYSEVQDWLGDRVSFRSNRSDYLGDSIVRNGNKYGW